MASESSSSYGERPDEPLDEPVPPGVLEEPLEGFALDGGPLEVELRVVFESEVVVDGLGVDRAVRQRLQGRFALRAVPDEQVRPGQRLGGRDVRRFGASAPTARGPRRLEFRFEVGDAVLQFRTLLAKVLDGRFEVLAGGLRRLEVRFELFDAPVAGLHGRLEFREL